MSRLEMVAFTMVALFLTRCSSGGATGASGSGGVSSTTGTSGSGGESSTVATTSGTGSSATGGDPVAPITFGYQKKVGSGGDYPGAVAVVDLDGDGHLDLVVANTDFHDKGGFNVGVLIGKGDGTFNPPQTYVVGPRPHDLAVGDFDGDGKPDVAVGTKGGTIHILHNSGNGQLTDVSTLPTMFEAALAAGDLDGDGHVDLVAGLVSGKVLFFAGTGSAFLPPVEVISGTEHMISLAVSDVTGDGRLDIVVPNWKDPTVSVLPGGAGGVFGALVKLSTGNVPKHVAIGDVNGDGKADLAFDDVGASLVLGTGNGMFAPTTSLGGDQAGGVVMADFDKDGHLDIAATVTGIDVRRGKGDGTFEALVTHPSPFFSGELAAGDFNGDGKPDLVFIGTPDAKYLSVYLNTTL